MNHFLDWKERVGSRPEKFFKDTLWQGEQMLVGLNCLEPNQRQETHAHDGADKFYLVLEGIGSFIVGDEEREAGEGSVIVAPARVLHGVTNNSTSRLSLLVAMAPPPTKK